MKSDILLRALELATEGIAVVPVATDGSSALALALGRNIRTEDRELMN